MGLFLIITSFIFSLFPQDNEIEIVFAGDAMQHQAQIDAALQKDGSYNYDDCFSCIEPYIKNADYAVVNLETPLGGKPYKGYPCFSAPDSYASALANAGFDLFLTANNHSLDKRDKGVVRTIDELDRQKIAHVGSYRNKNERDSVLPLIKNIGGINIAFLNYTYGTNGIKIQKDVVVDYIDTTLIKTDIQKARNKGARLITVAIHWGNEYQLLPHHSQKKLANFLIDQGVDMIIGSHPHVIQPMEFRYSEKHKKNILLVYSLGNFISNMKTQDTRGGALVKVKIKRDMLRNVTLESADYRLVFTIPATGKSNFHLIPAENCENPQWKDKCNAFFRSAEKIFNKHNINVNRDTISITDYNRK